MPKTYTPGQLVAFSQATIKRCGGGRDMADARGIVVSVQEKRGLGGATVAVDFRGTWIPHEDGGTVRHVPAINLTPVLTTGAVFGD